MPSLPPALHEPLVRLLLALGDDKLILGHRDSDWTGLGPILEEDIASSALAQDEIAHAQAVYELAAELTGTTADELAFGREPAAYHCAAIVELPDEFDWSRAIVRRFLCDHFDALRLERLGRSSFEPVALLARRLADEESVHIEHADAWVERLGRSTEEARRRLTRAFGVFMPHVASLFEPVEGEAALEAAGVYPPHEPAMLEAYRAAVSAVAKRAGMPITVPDPDPSAIGGRQGRHTPHLAPLLEEMCEVYRIEPEAAW